MDKDYIILLPDCRVQFSSVVNDFLNSTGLNKDFRLVLAEYEYTKIVQFYGKNGLPEEIAEKRTCLGLEALNEEVAFYWQLKGDQKMREMVNEYRQNHPFNRGVS